MGFRFYRRIKILPGIHINLGKRGASVSVGPRGAKMTFGTKGAKTSVGIPGTGIRYERKITSWGSGNGGTPSDNTPPTTPPMNPNEGVHAMSTASRGELPSDDIGQLVEHCRQSRKYSRMITVGIVLFAVVLACRCGWLWQHNGTLDVAIVLGIFTLLGMLVLRVVARDSQKISMDRFAPGGTDVVAVALQTAFNSLRVWYSSTQKVGTGGTSRSDALPFPMRKCSGVFAYDFGGVLLIPLRDSTIVVNGLSVEAVSNRKISMSVFRSSKTGSGHSPNPPDSQVTGRRWLHTTKKGLPDQRYSYNPCETTYQVGVLGLEAHPSFTYWITFSRSSAIERLEGIIPLKGRQEPRTIRHAQSVRVRGAAGTDYFSMIRKVSSDIVEFLQRVDADIRSKKMLSDIVGGEAFDSLGKYCNMNPRLTMLAYTDLRDTFRRLGYSTDDLSGLEGLGLIFAMVKIFAFEDVDVGRLKDPDYATKVAAVMSKCIREVGGEMNIKGTETPLMLHFVFGHSSGCFEWAVEYATLVYRWASVMAKADGTITPDEEKVLGSLMKLKDETSGSNVRISGGEAMNVASSGGLRAVSKRQVSRPVPKSCSPSEMFNGLIGLKLVRDEVEKLARFVEIQNLRASKGMMSVHVSYHCVFTGNPGTGKTTVARIVANIYKNLGVLKKGHLVETDRSGLVAEYVGQTAVKTNRVIDSALDGILFIDEAYSLAEGGKEDYGREAIATLLKRMEDDRDRLVVILAGYTNEIKSFIDTNPGLQSRFNRYIEFPDYSADELAQIFVSLAKKSQYRLNAAAEQRLGEMMVESVRNKDKNFGNARFVRNLFERTIERQALRLSSVAPITSEMLETIEACDLGGVSADRESAAAQAMDSLAEKTAEGRYVIDL